MFSLYGERLLDFVFMCFLLLLYTYKVDNLLCTTAL